MFNSRPYRIRGRDRIKEPGDQTWMTEYYQKNYPIKVSRSDLAYLTDSLNGWPSYNTYSHEHACYDSPLALNMTILVVKGVVN